MKNAYIDEVNCSLDDLRDSLQGLFTDIRYNFGIDDSHYSKDSIDPETIKMDGKEFELENEYQEASDDELDEEELEDEENYDDKIENYQNYEEAMLKLMNIFKENDRKKYELIILTMFHDECLMLNDFENKDYDINREVFKELEFKVNTKKDLFNLIDKDFTYLSDMISFFLDFCELDYFSRRKLFIDSKDLDKYLTKINPLHILDKFYYTMPYTEQTLLKVIDDNMQMKQNYIEIDPISSLSVTLIDLYYSDPNNYYNLMIPLINNYYKYSSYNKKLKSIDKTNEELISKIESWDLESILIDVANDMKFMEQIVEEFYNHNYEYNESYKNSAQEFYDKNINVTTQRKLTLNKKSRYDV